MRTKTVFICGNNQGRCAKTLLSVFVPITKDYSKDLI